ncbi:MAG: nicotinate-nucleotide--dimethylbenzimidazole phosphoribosyltransferase [Inquilinus sp.]|nr:nicotinate-nucleotide--dimethylbenzimidazole phosphoribosyltransferase [Inquilinus sp.]
MSAPSPAVTLAEMRDLARNLPGPDLEAGTAARERERRLTKPAGALGRLEEVAYWMACWQGRHPPELRHPRVAVFAANHGVARDRGVSAYPVAVTRQMVANFQAGGAAVNQLCRVADADLRVYELDLDSPTADFTQGPAMDEEGCARAMAYGMMGVEPGLHLLCLGEMGIGNTTAASALCAALFGGGAAEWVGPGTGVDPDGLARKVAAVEAGLAANRVALGEPLEVLRCLGGYELAAIVGAILAARLAKTPVLLDGFACTAAAAVLWALDSKSLDHCLVAHVSAEPGHRRLLDRIGREAILDLGMRLGEGSGAALAINVVRAAVDCHAGMASFDEAGVSGKA